MKKTMVLMMVLVFISAATAMAAYHHEGEKDADKFLSAYPGATGTKLDHCALCHSGGQSESKTLGSCQWCHDSYGYDGAGEIEDTINTYGADYKTAGRNAAAVTAIDEMDSDGDGYTNSDEIAAGAFPGNENDHPGLTPAPSRVYTQGQLEAMDQHTQFLLMNTSRSGDFYAEYTGVPLKDLLDDAGILPSASGITVYAPDGWSQYHPLNFEQDTEMYHIYGNMPGQSYQYPPATYAYNEEADSSKNPTDGWCDYSAPSCAGRSHGDAIFVADGLKAILAIAREDAPLDIGVLTDENKLDGEGPYRVVVPQKNVTAPDQSSKADNQDVIWPYNYDWDHNAGACSRSATIIRVEPLPQGSTDVDILEAGWAYVDSAKILIYGAIDGSDANGNGILDSEEKTDENSDYDSDGISDYMDTDTARLRNATGTDTTLLHCSKGSFASVESLADTDPVVNQTGKPALDYPYGVFSYMITDLEPGSTVEVTLVLADDVPSYGRLFKVTASGWQEIDFDSNNGDNKIRVKLTDGDPETDADGIANGIIVDPIAVGVSSEAPIDDDDDDDGSCFIRSVLQ